MGALLDAVPDGGADHTEHHRDLATAVEAIQGAYQPLDSDLTAIAALTTTAYGRSLLTLANQAALQSEAGGGGGALTPGVDYPTSATVTLSSAQILDLHNTPITLVAAPGAGKWVQIHRVIGYLAYGTADYVSSDTNEYVVGYDGGASTVAMQGLLSSTTTITTTAPATNAASASGMVNKAVVANANGNEFTVGDSALTVTVWYSIEDVPA